MKKTLLIFACALVLASTTQGQKPADAVGERFDLGGRTIVVPAPKGFTNGLGRFERFTTVVTATESPELDTLAAHVPSSMVEILTKGPAKIDFYTKVSVFKKARSIDVTLATFDHMIASQEKNFGSYLDPDSPGMKRMIENANTKLKEQLGTTMDFGKPKSLGPFDRKTGVLSELILMNVQGNGISGTLVGSVSYVLVNNRLIYVYGFKSFSSDEDVKTLEEFTKKWTAAIIAANKSPRSRLTPK